MIVLIVAGLDKFANLLTHGTKYLNPSMTHLLPFPAAVFMKIVGVTEIIPAIHNMKGKGINVEGPILPDIIFLQAVKGTYDVIVEKYHDQGHIPLKLPGFNSGVNISLGLPFIRTSVDNGTAFDIAWQGKADEGSMIRAIKMAH